MNKANLSVFASGVGSNLLAIHNASKDKCFPKMYSTILKKKTLYCMPYNKWHNIYFSALKCIFHSIYYEEIKV